MPKELDELQIRITPTVIAVAPGILANIWEELDYRVDIYHSLVGGHSQHL